MNQRQIKKQTRRHNKELCAKYPFLIPRNCFTGNIIPNYKYDYTWLDDMPEGWRRRFGDKIAHELGDLLCSHGLEDAYKIIQIKEKFGELRWYDYGVPAYISKEYDAIMGKYTELSMHTCINCGQAGRIVNIGGWYEPYCKGCYNIISGRYGKYGSSLMPYEDAITEN